MHQGRHIPSRHVSVCLCCTVVGRLAVHLTKLQVQQTCSHPWCFKHFVEQTYGEVELQILALVTSALDDLLASFSSTP
jgi:hypothetical protein